MRDDDGIVFRNKNDAERLSDIVSYGVGHRIVWSRIRFNSLLTWVLFKNLKKNDKNAQKYKHTHAHIHVKI